MGEIASWYQLHTSLPCRSFLTGEADNPMTGCDFDWMVSNHAVWGWKAPVKASVSGVSPSALFLFRFHLSPFPPETPDTQATFCGAVASVKVMDQNCNHTR